MPACFAHAQPVMCSLSGFTLFALLWTLSSMQMLQKRLAVIALRVISARGSQAGGAQDLEPLL